jgi:hypothetical protein
VTVAGILPREAANNIDTPAHLRPQFERQHGAPYAGRVPLISQHLILAAVRGALAEATLGLYRECFSVAYANVSRIFDIHHPPSRFCTAFVPLLISLCQASIFLPRLAFLFPYQSLQFQASHASLRRRGSFISAEASKSLPRIGNHDDSPLLSH